MVVDFEKLTKELKKLKAKKGKKQEKKFTKRLVSKKIIKPSQVTLTIKQREIEPYKPIHFKETFEQEKRSMFFD